MTRFEKRIQKFIQNPGSLKYPQIESLLYIFGFQKVETKGSHTKFKHSQLKGITIPVHNHDCKIIYKKHVAKVLKTLRHLE